MVESTLRFQRPSLPPPDAIEGYLALARERRWFSNYGPCWELLADRLAQATGAHCLPVSSCTAGLTIGLAALRRRRPDARAVLMPSFSFPAGAQAAAWNDLEPVFVDVDPGHWHLDPDALAGALDAYGHRVAVVVALSSFGTPPPPSVRDAWESLCAEAGVPLLVDSAAGFGARAADGRAIGAQGDLEVVSFHATKPLAAGEGGAVFSRDPGLIEQLRTLGNFGLGPDHEALDSRGTNAKMSEPIAAIALAALDELPERLEARRTRAARLLDGLPSAFERQAEHELGVWQFVPLLAPSEAARDAVLAAGRGRVELRAYYGALHLMPAFRDRGHHGSLEHTEDVAARSVSLPMAVDLTDDEIGLVQAVVGDGLSEPLPVRQGQRG